MDVRSCAIAAWNRTQKRNFGGRLVLRRRAGRDGRNFCGRTQTSTADVWRLRQTTPRGERPVDAQATHISGFGSRAFVGSSKTARWRRQL